MRKTAFYIMLLTVIAKFLGFGREIVLAYFYGASNISDAFLVAITIPVTIFALIGKSINTGYVPIYSNLEAKKNEKNAIKFTNNLINLSISICLVISILSFFYAEQIVKVFASGFEGETLSLAIKFTQVSMFGIAFTVLMEIFSSLLRMKDNFLAPALISLPMNLTIIIAIVISTRGNVLLLGYGILLSAMMQFLFLIPFVRKTNYTYSTEISLRDPNISKLLKLSVPIMIGVAVNDINKIVDRTIASNISEGAISSLNYANMINVFIQGVFVLSIATTIYPQMSKYASEENLFSFKKMISESITAVNLFVTPSIIGILFFSNEITALLFGRGAFDENAVKMTSQALFFYSFGILGIGLREILSRPFYALQETKTPVINASIGIILNVVLNIVLSRILGIGGLALATSISATFTTILMFISLHRRIGAYGLTSITYTFIKIFLASIIMGFVSRLAYNIIDNYLSVNISLILAIILGGLIYIFIISLMNIEEINRIIVILKKKLTIE